VDQESGVRFEGHHPLERPDLWKVYLNEAEGIFRSRGFEGTLRRLELEEGNDVSLFLLGFDAEGNAVAGVRFHGPLEGAHQAAIVEEMATSPEIGLIHDLIEQEIRLGAVEVKGAWSKGATVVGSRLLTAISRSVTHGLNWLGAEFAIAAVSDTLMPVGTATGGVQVGTHWVPFPDERYRTIAISWQRGRTYELATPENQQAYRREAEQLLRGPSRSGEGPIEPASTRNRASRPLILNVGERAQREVMRILREDSALQIIDRFAEQREQLAEIIPPVSDVIANEGSRWVYYPWRRAVVRLLAPKSFSTLRLDRNRNKLTRAEQARQRTLRVGVVGLSAGHSIAHVIAMEGLAGEIRLADFDTLELSNLNRIPASVLDLGVNKAVVAARRIAEIDPYLRVVVEPTGIHAENLGHFLDGLDLVIEECDSLDMKFLVREAARDRQIPVIMETSDRGVLDVERFDLEPDRPIFHGLLGDMDSSKLANLTTAQKGPYVIRLIGAREASARGAASLLEVGQTITGWPQLGSEITLGAATVAAAVRRIGLAGELPSGRVRFDVEEVLDGLGPVEVNLEAEADLFTPPPQDPPLVSDDPIEMIVDAARRAPSGGNVQPWRFEADDEEIRFFMIPERTSTMDVAHRATYVGIGAALFNARVQAAALKKLGPVKLFPEGRPSHHVASMRLGSSDDVAIMPLRDYLHSRSSNRRIGKPSEIEPETLATLTRGVEREGAQLYFATDRDRLSAGAELLAASDRLRFLLPTVHREMASEIRWPGRDSLDEGLDVRTLELDPGGYAALDILARPDVMAHLSDWRAGSALGMRMQASVMTSSALAVITVPRADPMWYLRGGAAMERFWLSAEMHGLAVQPASPVFLYAVDESDMRLMAGERYLDEMHNLSERFHEFWGLSDGETAVMVFRVFQAPPPTVHSVRLPLSHVLSRETETISPIEPYSVEKR
jgi:molybdopterin/thiamine biosynthesis adenylyltransferase/nitroreductase